MARIMHQNRSDRPAWRTRWLVFAALLVSVSLLLSACAAAETDVRRTDTPFVPETQAARATAVPRSVDGLRTIAFDDLPREARRTIQLIESGGPFPYRQDGSTFQNRERLLQRMAGGYYREYTVVTPGEDDRGARRVVAGQEGELYYTDDHYDSFRRVIR